MPVVPPPVASLAWLGLVAVYVALGWLRGASWRAIAGMPILVMTIVVAEFVVPAVLARTGDLRNHDRREGDALPNGRSNRVPG